MITQQQYDIMMTEISQIKGMLLSLNKTKLNPGSSDELSIKEAAIFCGLSVATIYTYMNTGKFRLESVSRGNKVFFKRSDVEKWNNDRTFSSIVKTKSPATRGRKSRLSHI